MIEHVVLFVETLGTCPTSAAIIQIGAASSKGRFFSRNISLTDNLRHGFVVDEPTWKFWLHQSEAARAAIACDGVCLREALREFSLWLLDGGDVSFKGRLWTLRPQFHITALAHAYGKIGLEVPWHYRAPACMRTFEMTATSPTPECTMIASKDAENYLRWIMAQVAF